jgi:hypothetical protein
LGYKTREIAGPILPGAPYGLGFGVVQLRAFEILMAWPSEGPEHTEKFTIH